MRSVGWAGLAALALAVLVLGWRHTRQDRWLTHVPPPPELTEQPAALQARLDDVYRRLRDGGDTAIAELGALYHANGFHTEAAACWTLLADRQPSQARWPYYRADLGRLRSDERTLRQGLEEALRREPTYAPAWLALAELEFKSDRVEAAERAYRERLRLVAHDPYARLGLARIRLQAGEAAAAEQALEELLRDTPDFPAALSLLAQRLEARGEHQAAEEHQALSVGAGRYRQADDPWLLELRTYCYDSYQLAVWGSQEEQSNRPQSARRLFERAIEIAPHDPVAYSELGELLLDAGEAAPAYVVLARGREQAPTHEKLRLRASRALRELGRAGEALELDRAGLELNPSTFELLHSLAQSQAALGQLDAAEQTYLEALRVSPHAVAAQVNLGVLQLKLGRREEARRTLEAALAAHPLYPKLLDVLGRLALEEGRWEQAEELIRAQLRQRPKQAGARALLADFHLRRAMSEAEAGDAAEAERWCTTGLAAVPEAADLLGLLGSLRLQRGDLAGALDAFERCQPQRPGDPRVVVPLASLYRQFGRIEEARRVLLEARDWLLSRGAGAHVGTIDRLLQTLPAP